MFTAKYVNEIAIEVRLRRRIARICMEIAKYGVLFTCAFFVGSGLYTITHPMESKADVEAKETQIYPESIERASSGSKLPQVDSQISKVPSEDFEEIRAFTSSYNGSRIDDGYLDLIIEACNEDVELVGRVVAGSVCESGMGRDVSKNSNFWGFFKGGDRGYDPDRATMAKVICESYNTDYKLLGESKRVTSRYTGGDNTDRWMSIYRWSLDKMSKEDK